VLDSVPAPALAAGREQVVPAIAKQGSPPQRAVAAQFQGTLLVESVPARAQVFVDRQALGPTPLRFSQLSAGSHVVRVEADGYEPWSAAVRVVADQRTRVTAQLRPSPARD
jgi:hypothetical protein